MIIETILSQKLTKNGIGIAFRSITDKLSYTNASQFQIKNPTINRQRERERHEHCLLNSMMHRQQKLSFISTDIYIYTNVYR